MSHTPYGYRIKNGNAVIDEDAAERVKELFEFYLSGDSIQTAAKKARLEGTHSVIGLVLRNARYIGDEFYPAIIDNDTFAAAQARRTERADTLGRSRQMKPQKEVVYPTAFCINEKLEEYDDPFRQVEYMYSLIESEVYTDDRE